MKNPVSSLPECWRELLRVSWWKCFRWPMYCKLSHFCCGEILSWNWLEKFRLYFWAVLCDTLGWRLGSVVTLVTHSRCHRMTLWTLVTHPRTSMTVLGIYVTHPRHFLTCTICPLILGSLMICPRICVTVLETLVSYILANMSLKDYVCSCCLLTTFGDTCPYYYITNSSCLLDLVHDIQKMTCFKRSEFFCAMHKDNSLLACLLYAINVYEIQRLHSKI